MRVQLDQFTVTQFRQVAGARLLRCTARDLVDAAGCSMNAGSFMAFAGVAPIEDVDAAIGAVAEVDSAEPLIAEEEVVAAVLADISGATALKDLLIGPAA